MPTNHPDFLGRASSFPWANTLITNTFRAACEWLGICHSKAGRLAWIQAQAGQAKCTTLDKIDPEELLDQADRALYETKKRSRNGYSVYRGSSGSAISGNVIQLNDFVAAEAKSKS